MANVIRRCAIVLGALALLLVADPVGASADSYGVPNLDDLLNLRVPRGNRVAFWAYAEGVQIYRWNGTSWAFVAPEAVLYSGDDEDDREIGIHYAGPTWEGASGGKVVGAVLERATPDPDAIPWLLLEAKSTEGAGIFGKVTYIQRLFTEGGLAPTESGDVVGEEARVPYSAWYVFYRKR